MPVRRAAGIIRPSHYWIQWQDEHGAVRSQSLDPMDSGLYRGHRVFATDDGRRLLVALLESVVARNSVSVWVWELDGDEWRPLAGAFAGTGDREVLPGLFVAEEAGGGLRASQVSDLPASPPPYVGFHASLTRPHFVLCALNDLGHTSDCNKALWTGSRFELESKESWGTAVRPVECAQLTLAGEAGLWSGNLDWALGRLGTPADQAVDGHRTDWQYPERGLTTADPPNGPMASWCGRTGSAWWNSRPRSLTGGSLPCGCWRRISSRAGLRSRAR
ncbi:hypothetical protein J2Z79_000158 [Symbiobacterium terraclitae]|uniref:Uncharacterized protein n=1 Tax=Symbiobacterium terraclitae TaxID=557451 RepID=A0ABS4JP81_9FIRM|nr:hypothetical protein [Symbiobacterium terraclitae]